MAVYRKRNVLKLSVALMAGAFALPFVAACQPGMPTSLEGMVEDMAGRAGSDRVSRVKVERVPDEGLRVNAVFLKEDGSAVEYLKSPYDDLPHSLGTPPLKVPASNRSIGEFGLKDVERRLDEVPDCEDPRADVAVFGEHIAENFRCGQDGPPTGQLDGVPVSQIPAGDFAAAVDQLRQDLDLLDSTAVAAASIGMTSSEAWTSLHAAEPEIPATDGNSCALLMTRAGGAFVPRCTDTKGQVSSDALDQEAMTKIWEAEGKPTEGWLLELHVENDEAHWRATSGSQSRKYSLEGDRL